MPIDYAQFDAVLLDLDGTVYREDHPLPGAADLVRKLQRDGRRFACLSNSTTSPARAAQRLAGMGMQIDPAHIYTAAAAAVDYVLERHGPAPAIFNLSTEGLQEMLENQAAWVESAEQECDAVIVGAMTNVYATEPRQRLAMMLLRQGAELVGICADRVFPSPRGLEFGTGAFCALLGYAANVKPVFCGKPLPVFFDKLCAKLGVRPQSCVLIGDNLESDILGAKGVGMKTILTLTGVAGKTELASLAPELRPDDVIDDLRDLL